jgi:arsenate reductase
MSVRAFSAGTAAGDRINPVAAEAMAEVGIAMEGMHPKTLTREMADTADIIITMGCGVDAEACPALRYVSEDWGLEDPAGQSIAKVREVRDQICRRVQDLLNRLSSER